MVDAGRHGPMARKGVVFPSSVGALSTCGCTCPQWWQVTMMGRNCLQKVPVIVDGAHFDQDILVAG